MFDLYIANKNYSSWSLRPWVLLKALEIPFNEHLMPFEGGFGESHTTFKRFSPSGLVPCLVDNDHNVAVWGLAGDCRVRSGNTPERMAASA